MHYSTSSFVVLDHKVSFYSTVQMHTIKKYFCESNTIFDSLSPFYWTQKLFGLTSFHLNFENGLITTSISDLFILCCFCFLYIFIILFFARDLVFDSLTISILDTGWKYQILYQAIMTFGIVLHNFWKRKTIEKFIKLVHKFDAIITRTKWKHSIDHTDNRWKLSCWMILSFLNCFGCYYLTVFVISGNELLTIEYYEYLCYYFIVQVNTMITAAFILSIHSVESRFECLVKNAGY